MGCEVRVVVRHKGFAALQVSVSASPSSEPAKLSRSCLACLTSVSTTPAADFCCRVRMNCSTLSHESETCNRSPAISSTAFDTRPPDLTPASSMDTDPASCRTCAAYKKKPWEVGFPGPWHEPKHPFDVSGWVLQPPAICSLVYLSNKSDIMATPRSHAWFRQGSPKPASSERNSEKLL